MNRERGWRWLFDLTGGVVMFATELVIVLSLAGVAWLLANLVLALF